MAPFVVIGEFMFVDKSKSLSQLFYERWKSIVFKFCLLVTGNQSRAEESTAEGFIEYARQGGEVCGPEVPPTLLKFALRATQKSFSPPPLEFRLKTLQYSIFTLPTSERVAFAIRHALNLPLSTAALVLEVSTEEATMLCFSALMRLRESLPDHFYGRSEWNLV